MGLKGRVMIARLLVSGLALLAIAAHPKDASENRVVPERPLGKWRVESIQIWDEQGNSSRERKWERSIWDFRGDKVVIHNAAGKQVGISMDLVIRRRADDLPGSMDLCFAQVTSRCLYQFVENRLEIISPDFLHNPRPRGFHDRTGVRLTTLTPVRVQFVQP
jgi:hypothetical protein